MISGKEEFRYGAVAQLGERLNGIQEVVGSIPSSSTRKSKGLTTKVVRPFLLLVLRQVL